MFTYLCEKVLQGMSKRYDYDVGYMQDMLRFDKLAFTKFMMFQPLASHQGGVPQAELFAAKLRAIIWEDCGPCTQLVVNLALEANVDKEIIRAVIERDVNQLSSNIALVVEFTELALAHHPRTIELREKIVELWGEKGLIALGLAISSMRVYPTLKYSLGYGDACAKIAIEDETLAPFRHTEVEVR